MKTWSHRGHAHYMFMLSKGIIWVLSGRLKFLVAWDMQLASCQHFVTWPMGKPSRHTTEISVRYLTIFPQLLSWLWQQKMTERPKAYWIYSSPRKVNTDEGQRDVNQIFWLGKGRQWLLQNILEESQTVVAAALGLPMEWGAGIPERCLVDHHW